MLIKNINCFNVIFWVKNPWNCHKSLARHTQSALMCSNSTPVRLHHRLLVAIIRGLWLPSNNLSKVSITNSMEDLHCLRNISLLRSKKIMITSNITSIQARKKDFRKSISKLQNQKLNFITTMTMWECLRLMSKKLRSGSLDFRNHNPQKKS